MEHLTIESRALRSLAYDAENQVLLVEWQNGRAYRYLRVPPSVFDWIRRVPNKGSVFNRMVRDRYDYEEVFEEEPGEDNLLEQLRDSLAPPTT